MRSSSMSWPLSRSGSAQTHAGRGGRGGAGPRAAEGMPDRDRAAVRVDPRVLEVDVHQLEAAEHLAGEGLVDLDDVPVPARKAGALQGKRNRVCRADAHD